MLKFNSKVIRSVILLHTLFSCRNIFLNSNKGFEEDKIFYCIFENQFDEFKKIFKNLKDKNIVNGVGNSLLHESVKRKRELFVDYILSENVSTSIVNRNNQLAEELTGGDLNNKIKKLRYFQNVLKSIKEGNKTNFYNYLPKLNEEEILSGTNTEVNILNVCLDNAKKGLFLDTSIELFDAIISEFPKLVDILNNNVKYLDITHSGKNPLHVSLELMEENILFKNFVCSIITKGKPNLLIYDKFEEANPLEMILSSHNIEIIELAVKQISNTELEKIIKYFFDRRKELSRSYKLNYSENLLDFYKLISYFINFDLISIDEQKISDLIDILILSFIIENSSNKIILMPGPKDIFECQVFTNHSQYSLDSFLGLTQFMKQGSKDDKKARAEFLNLTAELERDYEKKEHFKHTRTRLQKLLELLYAIKKTYKCSEAEFNELIKTVVLTTSEPIKENLCLAAFNDTVDSVIKVIIKDYCLDPDVEIAFQMSNIINKLVNEAREEYNNTVRYFRISEDESVHFRDLARSVLGISKENNMDKGFVKSQEYSNQKKFIISAFYKYGSILSDSISNFKDSDLVKLILKEIHQFDYVKANNGRCIKIEELTHSESKIPTIKKNISIAMLLFKRYLSIKKEDNS